MIDNDEGCAEYPLDDDLSIFVGWSDGYDTEKDDTIIQSKSAPSWVINAGIKSNHDYLKTDYDWLNFPFNEETGDVWEIDVPISPNEDYTKLARWFMAEYKKVREALDNNVVVLESKSVKKEFLDVSPEVNISTGDISSNMDLGGLGEIAGLLASEEKENCENCGKEKIEETDATDDFLTDYKDLLNKYCRTSVESMKLETSDSGTEYIVINGNKKINVTANSNLAIIKVIANELL